MVSKIIVVRHGRTEWNISGRIQGSTDIPLDEVGTAQAADAAEALAEYKPSRIVSSDLSRAVATAEPVADLVGVAIERDARLRERAFGPWEGLKNEEIRDRFAEDHMRWKSGRPVENPEIETWDALQERCLEAVEDLTHAADGTLMVFTHGGAARHLIAGILGWDHDAAGALAGMDNVHWTDLRRMKNGRWRMFGFNLGVRSVHDLGSSPLSKANQS
ncbi:histidine phosphatase family protein [Salininema proteolyticum]|uniref:Histidine phosphatase family protein n=1 Tax=Salininema proteolyticum TaxID=1607685 RepID=A0ABV8TV92_9ACTN